MNDEGPIVIPCDRIIVRNGLLVVHFPIAVVGPPLPFDDPKRIPSDRKSGCGEVICNGNVRHAVSDCIDIEAETHDPVPQISHLVPALCQITADRIRNTHKVKILPDNGPSVYINF